jgi:hypothetical protein
MGPNFFVPVVWFWTKIVLFLAQNYNFPLIYPIFLNYFALWKKKTNNISLYEYILWGAELFCQRTSFIVDLSEKIC